MDVSRGEVGAYVAETVHDTLENISLTQGLSGVLNFKVGPKSVLVS